MKRLYNKLKSVRIQFSDEVVLPAGFLFVSAHFVASSLVALIRVSSLKSILSL